MYFYNILMLNCEEIQKSFSFKSPRNSIFLHDVTIDCVCTSAVKFCLRGTHSYIEVNVFLARFLTARVL